MRKRIGEFLIEKGVLTENEVQQILRHASTSGLRFGEAGMDLGLLTRDSMIRVFGPSYAVDFFHLEPSYFPEMTRDLLTSEQMIRLGVLPLGLKKATKFFRTQTLLNLGMLDPSRQEAFAEVLTASNQKGISVQGVKPFLVLADQFLLVLEQVYRLKMEQFTEVIGSKTPQELDPTLQMFLEGSRP